MSDHHDRPIARPVASTTMPSNRPLRKASQPIADATVSPISALPASGRRISYEQLHRLSRGLADRDRQLLETVHRLRLLQGSQARRLFFTDVASESDARTCRRALQRLRELGLLRALERRIGGRRAGSSGIVYTTTSAGRRLVALWHAAGDTSDRGPHEPGAPFVAHTLAIADQYVTLVEAERAGILELLDFDGEPACWRSFANHHGASNMLKPDALVRVAAGDYDHAAFVEVDLGTEGRGALRRKCDTYLAYYQSGREQAREGFFPRVVWIAPTAQRAAMITTVIDALPAATQQLFTTVTADGLIPSILGNDATHQPEVTG